jgi:hypothetical protein
MMSMMGSALPTLLVFPQERPVVVREYCTDHYTIVAYFLARLTMEAFLTFIQMLLLVSSSWSAGLLTIILGNSHAGARSCDFHSQLSLTS